MASIGPQIPAHLLGHDNDGHDDSDEVPARLREPSSTAESHDEDDVEPRLGPEYAQAKRVTGPSVIACTPTHELDDSDDDIGPKPLQPGTQQNQPDAVRDFMEKEEKRRKALEEASKPKAPKREEWMIVPPTTSSLLGKLDPTKLKGRQFSRGSTSTVDNDMSLWTETPAERQRRLADEVTGKKRRVTDTHAEEDEESNKKRQRKREEAAIRKDIDHHTRARRGPALVEQHADSLAKKPAEREPSVIWDHSRDMAIGGRLLDDGKRSKMLKDAKGLGEKFNSGSSGFL